MEEKRSSSLTEFVGIMLGDGNIYRKGKYNQVRIVGNKNTDNEYFVEFIAQLIGFLFKIKARVRYGKNNDVIVYFYDKNIVNFLKKIGLRAALLPFVFLHFPLNPNSVIAT